VFAPSLTLVVLLLAGAGPSPSPSPAPDHATLIEQLGSPRFSEREQAATALRELGADALPALRTARSAGDAEVRTRAAAILDRVECELMVLPTLVKLDFREQPLGEILKALGERSRMVMLPEDPENQATWQDRRISLQAPAPVPYWTAVDRLCAAGMLRFSLGASPDAVGREQPGLLLSAGKPKVRPESDQGPFRVKVTRLHHSRDRNLDAEDDDPEAEVVEEFHVQLEVWAEPRLLIGQVGPLTLIEAADDRGRSLLPPADAKETVEVEDESYDDEAFGQGAVQLQASLKFPASPAKTIRRLRGSVPILVAARKAEPLDLPLSGPLGQLQSNGEVRVIVHEVKNDPDGSAVSIALTVRPASDPAVGAVARSGEGPSPSAASALEQQIEIADAKGQIHSWSLTNQEAQGDGIRVTLSVIPNEPDSAPTRLRVFGLSRATIVVNFDFKDVPVP